MATEVSICSNALRRLGDSPITSLSDDTERARLCNSFYSTFMLFFKVLAIF